MLKVILADNQAIFRAGAAKVLAVEDDLRIVAQAQAPEQVMLALEKFHPAILLIAAAFHPDIKAVMESATKGKTRTVIIAENGDEANQHVKNGAAGIIYRNITGDELVQCVRKVARGE